MLKLYSIYDKVAGGFSSPMTIVNNELAKLYFPRLVKGSEVYEFTFRDTDLYCLGEFDKDTGCIKSYDRPVFICNYTEVAVDE